MKANLWALDSAIQKCTQPRDPLFISFLQSRNEHKFSDSPSCAYGSFSSYSPLTGLNESRISMKGWCKICNVGVIENTEHLLITCRDNMVLWKLIEQVIHRVFGYFYRIDSIAIILGFWSARISQNPSELSIINVLMGICRYHIWNLEE